MPTAAASNETSHPVEVECPFCGHRFQMPLQALSAGVPLHCRSCRSEIPIATPALRQLLREIDKDLRSPDDLPIVLRPPACRPVDKHKVDKNGTTAG